jgi:outer membrane protein TolC
MSNIHKKNKIQIAVITACLTVSFFASSNVSAGEAGKMSLAEAVKMTLELSPNRFIQQAEMAKAQAGVDIQEGAFNINTSAGISYGQIYEPLNHFVNGTLAGPGFTGKDARMTDFTMDSARKAWKTQNVDPVTGSVKTETFDQFLARDGNAANTCGASDATPCFVYNNYWARSVATLHAELSKYFENGINAVVSMADTQINQINLSPDTRPNANTTAVKLRLNIPLLKNGGTESAAAFLNSAKKGQEGAINDYKFFLTDLTRGVIAAYWDYRYAVDSVQIRQMSKDRVGRISAQVTSFAANPKMKGKLENIIHTTEAAQVNRNRLLIEAQQNMEQKRTQFAFILGVTPDQIATVPEPADSIPAHIIPKEFDQQKFKAQWRKIAMENRLDLQAANLYKEGANFIVAKRQRDLYPQVDLNAEVGYQGLKEGSKVGNMWDALGTNVPGPTWSTGVEFSYPLGNQAAEGQLKIAQANFKQAELRVYQKTRNIDSDILVQLGFVDRYVHAIVPAEQAVVQNRAALDAWKRSPLIDPSSILGMLQTEQQLTEANLTELQIRADYAKTVADVRYTTGVLGKTGSDNEDYSISLNDVTQLPQ